MPCTKCGKEPCICSKKVEDDQKKGAKEDVSAEKKCPKKPKKELVAKIIEIEFTSAIKVCRSKKVISGPHWKTGEDHDDQTDSKIASTSKKPAVYKVKTGSDKDRKAQVKIKIEKAENISGQGDLSGNLDSLEFEGKCPLSVKTHTVTVQIKDPPDNIKWLKGDIAWNLKATEMDSPCPLDSTRAEIFFILDTPLDKIYQSKKGVWAEALRFLCQKASIQGEKEEKEVVKKITEYCHGSHSLRYESKGGDPQYDVGWKGGKFNLTNYLKRSIPKANCYDQAAAIQALCGAVGIKLKWRHMDPCGFIQTTKLLGGYNCNNPFWENSRYNNNKVVPCDDLKRSCFGNHSFCDLKGKILDACAKPHIGDETAAEYVKNTIDDKRTINKNYNGTEADIISQDVYCTGLTGID